MAGRYYASTQGSEELIIDILNKEEVIANGSSYQIDRIKNGLYEVSVEGETHRVLIVKREGNTTRVMINGRLCDVQTETEGEKLIKQLGLDKVRKKKLKDLKAPMPGLVLKVMVEEGQQVAKGDALLVLEAMKMENLIKAADDATIGGVSINEGQAVEKGQLLIKFN